MHLPHLLHLHKPRSVEMDPKQHHRQQLPRRKQPRLDRRNAIKNILYDAVSSPSADDFTASSSSSASLRTRSLDLPPYTGQTSFRIQGNDVGEFDRLCRNLGLSGPEDFAIPTADWEARKARSSSDLFPRSRLNEPDSPSSAVPEERRREEDDLIADFMVRVNVSDKAFPSGIKGPRPPVLAPPPSMSRPVLDKTSSTWEIFRLLAPEDPGASSPTDRDMRADYDGSGEDGENGENEEVDEVVGEGYDEKVGRLGETADLTRSCSFSTSNDDDSSSTTTETLFVISPNGKFKRNIKSWERGGLLGSGSFGTVYEGISNDGFFFAVKEVSLLDQGSRAQQCIQQLEHEIALLSKFEHENIVQYLGTDKEEANLYIFLELVTQGSLARLYERYHLRDSQVSAYTRQILCGLKYLHDRDVMHRDIKCANILVDATGSVKLADFGLAKETSKLSMQKSCKGSAYWMAPEVVNPRKSYGLAADIWSLGCTVLEMLTRQVPYAPFEWMQALYKIGHGEPPPIPNSLSKEAKDFIQQCVQIDPAGRPSASDLLEHPFVRRLLPAPMGSVSPHDDRRT